MHLYQGIHIRCNDALLANISLFPYFRLPKDGPTWYHYAPYAFWRRVRDSFICS